MTILTIDEATQIHYRFIEGKPDRPWLVFLHEGLGCTGMWKDFPQLLCNRTGCPGLVYDRQGYGRSSSLTRPRTVHYLHDSALNELPRVIAQLIPQQEYFLIGHSDGGSIALIHAAEKPARLLGVITEAAHVFVEKETLDGINVATDAFNAGKLRGLEKYHGAKTEEMFRAWSDVWRSAWFKHWNIEYLLPSIDCPVLAIQGIDDQYGTAAQLESIAGKALHAERSLLENCGHAPHHEQPEAVLQAMQDFLQRHMS